MYSLVFLLTSFKQFVIQTKQCFNNFFFVYVFLNLVFSQEEQPAKAITTSNTNYSKDSQEPIWWNSCELWGYSLYVKLRKRIGRVLLFRRSSVRFDVAVIGFEVFIKDGDHTPSICLSFSPKRSNCSTSSKLENRAS